jgi:hypothetical protein
MQDRTIISMALFIHKQFSSWEFKNKFDNPCFRGYLQTKALSFLGIILAYLYLFIGVKNRLKRTPKTTEA